MFKLIYSAYPSHICWHQIISQEDPKTVIHQKIAQPNPTNSNGEVDVVNELFSFKVIKFVIFFSSTDGDSQRSQGL